MNKKILMVVTSQKQMGMTNKETGLWAEELAVPYYAMLDAGVDVTISSVIGGKAPIDPGSIKAYDQADAAVQRMLNDSNLQLILENTISIREINVDEFDAVFFPGGHGTMWDFPFDSNVKKIVEDSYTNGKFIASVCHGVAALVSAVRSDGMPLVKGKRINSFTDSEEHEVGLDGVVPFLLETRLRELGANFEAADNWHAFAVQDGQLITGQNPQSSALVINMLITAVNNKQQKLGEK